MPIPEIMERLKAVVAAKEAIGETIQRANAERKLSAAKLTALKTLLKAASFDTKLFFLGHWMREIADPQDPKAIPENMAIYQSAEGFFADPIELQQMKSILEKWQKLKPQLNPSDLGAFRTWLERKLSIELKQQPEPDRRELAKELSIITKRGNQHTAPNPQMNRRIKSLSVAPIVHQFRNTSIIKQLDFSETAVQTLGPSVAVTVGPRSNRNT